MAVKKNYKSNTGVEEFYYGVLDKDNELKIKEASPELVDFLQTITVSREQSLERAEGSNKVAEMATVNGAVSIEGAFHKLPKEDKIKLFGLEESEDKAMYAMGSDDVSPYVACVFAMTYEDGHKEWVGLPKGKFFMNDVSEAETAKKGEKNFGTSPISAEFMDREVPGFAKEKSAIFAETEKGDGEAINEFFQAIFGTNHPSYEDLEKL